MTSKTKQVKTGQNGAAPNDKFITGDLTLTKAQHLEALQNYLSDAGLDVRVLDVRQRRQGGGVTVPYHKGIG